MSETSIESRVRVGVAAALDKKAFDLNVMSVGELTSIESELERVVRQRRARDERGGRRAKPATHRNFRVDVEIEAPGKRTAA